MAQASKSPKVFTAGEALAAYRRVKLASGSGTSVVYADAADDTAYIGTTIANASSGEHVPVEFKGRHTTVMVTAAEAFAAGASLYAADDGKVGDTDPGDGTIIGTALEAASADGAIVESLLY